MIFVIADTFTDALKSLTNDEQKQVKTTVFDLQLDPSSPGHQFHRIKKSKDPNFWSVRVGRDVRMIVHRTDNSLLVCYVDHHDDAYRWAERRKLETHPKTGAAQLVKLEERVEDVVVEAEISETPVVSAPIAPKSPVAPLFASIEPDRLLAYGVPPELLERVQSVDEDGLFTLSDDLPSEAAEALLELATGGNPSPSVEFEPDTDPFLHPDAQRRFRIVQNQDELEEALDSSWEKWTVFLHPTQRSIVESDFSGPARITGSAGTGKTIVAIHRTAHLARTNPDSSLLLTTFSPALANLLQQKLRRLLAHEPKVFERVEVASLDEIGWRRFKLIQPGFELATPEQIASILTECRDTFPDVTVSLNFVKSEWEEVIDNWQIRYLDDYLNFRRLGRMTRLPEPTRKLLWQVFQLAFNRLEKENLVTNSQVFFALAEDAANRTTPQFDHVIVDEAQDLSVSQLKFLAADGADRRNALFFAGDSGQRIFRLPYSWLSVGVDIRGRSTNLKVNYRTSHQIRACADRLLDPQITDVDGNEEFRNNTVSVFNGPDPTIYLANHKVEEIQFVADWIEGRVKEGDDPSAIAVFVRSEDQMSRANEAIRGSGLDSISFGNTSAPGVFVGTMHDAKGMEFKSVVVMACDDEVLPLRSRIESDFEEAGVGAVYDTERHLFYVACTRARDHLLLTGNKPGSEFLDDLLL